MDFKELTEKLNQNSLQCDDRVVDLRGIKYEVKDGESKLVGESITYFFKNDPQNPKDPTVVHAAKQFCSMIGVPFSFYFKNPEMIRKQLVDCWLPSLGAEKSIVLMKVRRTGPESQGWIIRAVLPAEFTNISNLEVLEKISAATHDDFLLEFVIGEGRDELVFHVRLIAKEQFEAFGEQCSVGFSVTASELGACPLTVETLLFRTPSRSALMASYAGEPYFSCVYEMIQPKDLLTLFPQLIGRMKSQLPEIKDRIQATKELKFAQGGIEQALLQLRLKKGLSEKFHVRLQQVVQGEPPKDTWDLANKIAVIAKDFDIERRVKIEKAAGALVGLTFAKV